MPKPAAQKESSNAKRIDALETELKKRDDEIIQLNNSFEIRLKTVEKTLLDEIATLKSKIDTLTTADAAPDLDVPKIEHDLLVIGDSIARDVESETVNPGGETDVEFLPGARPADVMERFRELSKTESYKRIAVHVGSNMIPAYSRSYVADRIVECMEMIRELSPDSKIAFSCILPKVGDHLLAGIDEINFRVTRSGRTGPPSKRYGFIDHSRHLTDSRGRVNPLFFKQDGIHLSQSGIAAFNQSLKGVIAA